MAFDRSAIKDSHIKVGNKSIKVADATDAQLKAAAIANPNILKSGWSVTNGNVVKVGNSMTETKPVTGANQQAAADKAKADAKAAEARQDAARRAAQEQQQKDQAARSEASGAAGGPNPSGQPQEVWDPAKAFENDPWYRQQKAELDYQRAQKKNSFDSLMGVDGAKGSIWSDWQYAIDALTRSNRGNISSANAGLSGSNLAGSGIARKTLSDIAASFFADKTAHDTKRKRDEDDALRDWTDFTTQYGVQDGALMSQAAERWKALHPQGSPVLPAPTPPKAPQKPVATKPAAGVVEVPKGTPAPTWKPGTGPNRGGVTTVRPGTPAPTNPRTAPPGYAYVKNPVTGKYTLKRK